MSIRVAINGYGRIGHMVLRALYEMERQDITIVAINSRGSNVETSAHLTRYDSVHGKFPWPIEIEGDSLLIRGNKINCFASHNPAELPWKSLAVDVVLECSGNFNSRLKAQVHLDAGAKKVLLSAPAEGEVDATIVYGVNHQIIKSTDIIVSSASCTTNGLAPMVLPLQRHIGIVSGLMNTIHAYTHDQSLTDSRHQDLRRARAAPQSMIPSKTGAASSIGLILPELAGKLDGFAIRVPTPNVSLVDLTFTAERPTSVAEVNQIMQDAALGELQGILSYNTAPLVSVDFNHSAFSSNFDATLTKVSQDGRLVKVCAWYDNEWAFSCRMLDNVVAMMSAR